jgi:spore coat protein A, manganese oxidase
MLTRREFIRNSLATGGTVYLAGQFRLLRRVAAPQQGSLDPLDIDKYEMPLGQTARHAAAGQFIAASGELSRPTRLPCASSSSRFLPPSLPPTTVWSYGAAAHPETFNYPAFTIEAAVNALSR